ncbi:MAG: hypothetical protein ACI4XL_05710 [Bacillus sp. (in: firmicutes)]
MRKKIMLAVALLFVISVASNYYIQNNSEPVDIDGRLAPGTNNIGIGMYDEKEDIIPEGTKLEVSGDSFKSKVSISHFIEMEREYKLLIFNDFKQASFDVEGRSADSYDVTIQPNQTADVEVTNNISEDTKEVDYLVIKDPNHLIEKLEIENMNNLQQVLPLKFSTRNPVQEPVESLSPESVVPNDLLDGVFLSKEKNNLTIVPQANSGEEVYLSVGNLYEDPAWFALVALLDWKQIPFNDNQLVHFVKVNPGERNIYWFTLPNVEQKKNFQVLGFLKPYNVSEDDYRSHLVEGSVRTVILPDK